MLRTMLDARPLVAMTVAARVGTWGLSAYPLPMDNVFLEIMALRNPAVLQLLGYTYATFWFTTPFLATSLLLSVLAIVAYHRLPSTRAHPLPHYPLCAFILPESCGVIDSVIAAAYPHLGFERDPGGYVKNNKTNADRDMKQCEFLAAEASKLNAKGHDFMWRDLDGARHIRGASRLALSAVRDRRSSGRPLPELP